VLAVVALGAACASGHSFTGVITEVSADHVTVVAGDRTETFTYEPGLVPLDHLQLHRDQALPVRVKWERRDGEQVATAIEDG
jgi:hypothetical protein